MLEFKRLIDEQGISSDIVQKIIEAHKKEHDRMKKLYERYKADLEGPTIFSRQSIQYEDEDFETGGNVRRLDDKVNNLLNNAFDADIVDTKVGYMFGHPIGYNLTEDNAALREEIDLFALRNNSEDVDSEFGKMAAICGQSARLAYICKNSYERIKNIDPWEVVFLGDDIHEPTYSLRYYTIGDDLYAEFYDDSSIHFFKQSKGSTFVPGEVNLHMFDYNPLFGLANNLELKGDAEKVLSLIDAYDRTLSDASNEIEQYRLAYLVLKGMGADEETLRDVKKSGMFELFEKDDSVSYLTKDINDGMIENHLDRLEENILRFAKSVNFADKAFGGQVSGVAMKYKIMALENKSITMERKFISSLRYQFKVIFSAWAKRKSIGIDEYLKMWFAFKRNLPINLLDEAQSTAQLKGNVSERTRISLLPFVDDVDLELEELREDELIFGNRLEPIDEEAGILDFGKSGKGEGSGGSSSDMKPCKVCSGTGKVPSTKTGNSIQCPTCKGMGVVR